MRVWILIRGCGARLGTATHEIYPDHHSRAFPAHETPVLRTHLGDSVITKTRDSGGQGYTGKRHLQHPYVYPDAGNPLVDPVVQHKIVTYFGTMSTWIPRKHLEKR